jgi:hypothetical protein
MEIKNLQFFKKSSLVASAEAFVAAWFGIPFSWGMDTAQLGNPFRVFYSGTEYPVSRTVALGSTQPLTEMSTRNISWG